mmetsp:Transcript_51326/g.77961  ORF Transcript_51326/g.77961 Transcript_51326/m.77961 type:complete len:718 (+) Transcript_51326:343-2496(+)
MGTPVKAPRGICAVASPQVDADVSMDADDSFCSESMLASPPKAPRSRARHATASRLFADDDDDDDQFSAKPSSVLRPLDLNLALTDEGLDKDLKGPQQRKRQAEQPLFGRDLSFDDVESPVDMYSSPRNSPSCYKSPAPYTSMRSTVTHKSPAYRTLDGRTVQSKNPFSPMVTEDHTHTPRRPIELSDSLNFPVSFGDEGKKKTSDGQSLPNVAPILRHRLHKRDTPLEPSTFNTTSYEYNSFTRDGYPDQTGQFSFTGSPIKEMDHPSQVDQYAHKLRRRHKGDDVRAAASHVEQPYQSLKKKKNKNLHVNTRYRRGESSRHEGISPTDVMNFPFGSPSSPSGVPPAPIKPKHNRRPTTRYAPVKKSAAPPQTPMLERKARSRSFEMDDEDDDQVSSSNSSAQHYVPQSRFYSDFDVIEELGSGSFGNVFKVLSRLDGCMYAIKVAHRQAKGMLDKERMMKEVYALAALSDHADTATFHIVRYHQAWMEEHRLYIQTELCTSTLSAEMKQGPLTVDRRYKFLREVSLALEFIHKNGMVHLDIKPENIFIKNDQFKLGDFGLVSKVSNHQDVEEGDSRYMSNEMLSGEHDDLTKSDIFSLGITLYELCLGGRGLPSNGPEWQALRSGNVKQPHDIPNEMFRIMQLMMNPAYMSRPSASELLKRPQLLSCEQKALLAERNKVVQANLALAAQASRFQMLRPSVPPRGTLVRSNTWNGG